MSTTGQKKKPKKLIAKILLKNNVPWGEVKKFSEFLKTKTAKNYFTNGSVKDKNIIVPKCAISVAGKKNNRKSVIPDLGQHNNKILKSLGYSKKNINGLKKNYIID